MFIIKHFHLHENPHIHTMVYDRFFTWGEAKAFIDAICYAKPGIKKSYLNKECFDQNIESDNGSYWNGTIDTCMMIGDFVYFIEEIKSTYSSF
jgi:hypothetical protein